MTARDFCYWLQGKLEIDQAKHDESVYTEALTAKQVACIKRHLALVFVHDIDPKAGGPEVQDKLNSIHNKGIKHPPGMRC